MREAVGVPDSVPIVTCDARDRRSVKSALVGLMDEVVRRHTAVAA